MMQLCASKARLRSSSSPFFFPVQKPWGDGGLPLPLAFLAPNLVKAAVEGRLPRGIGIERLRDPPTEWSRQFEALGLNPE